MNRAAVHIAALWIFFLSGCATHAPAPVADRTFSPRGAQTERVVVAGDTLYSIAWDAGHDYKDVARWNDISAPYLLQPGQRLRLIAPAGATDTARKATITKKPATPRPPAVAKSRKSKASSRPLKTQPARLASSDFGPWAWPTRGKLIHSYSASTGGIDIAGSPGQAILAAADGRVVYSGSGLRGYGQLIILKHNDDFLSAYAHNEKIFVKEGDTIKRGRTIAAMGSSGADRTKLHFEIRRRGVPVDPIQYLPKN